MEQQNYKNHVRYYAPHHFIFYPLSLVVCIGCAWSIFHAPGEETLWIALTAICVLLIMLAFMLRQHYALTNQNRIVLLELRFRYYLLTHERLDLLENALSKSQLFALRFASDAELPKVVNRALTENLSADSIKRAIKDWRPDYLRVWAIIIAKFSRSPKHLLAVCSNRGSTYLSRLRVLYSEHRANLPRAKIACLFWFYDWIGIATNKLAGNGRIHCNSIPGSLVDRDQPLLLADSADGNIRLQRCFQGFGLLQVFLKVRKYVLA